jgi:hypothetical protein
LIRRYVSLPHLDACILQSSEPDTALESSKWISAPLPTKLCEKQLTWPLLQLSKYPALNNFEKQTNVPKVYVFLGLATIYVFLVFFNIAGEFLVNFAGFLVPGYYSLEALFSTSKVDDTQVSTHKICLYHLASSL